MLGCFWRVAAPRADPCPSAVHAQATFSTHVATPVPYASPMQEWQRAARSIVRLLVGVVLVLFILIASVVVAVNLMFPGPTAAQVAAMGAGDRLVPLITSLRDGDTVDLVRALDVRWDRAVLMEAYMQGDEMNGVLGFDWYHSDDWSGGDESQRRLAFVSGHTVVADLRLSYETFRMDAAIDSFDASDPVFVARRDESGVVFLYRP